MTTYIIGWLAIAALTPCFVVAGLLVLHLMHEAELDFFSTFPGEVEMPTPEQLYPSSHAPRARVVQTYEGDSLAQGVCRAMILAMEYKVVVLIHDFVAVMVFPGDDAEEIATEWHETRRVLNTIKCNGK
jgi:hypothetical protein